jgi:hypothetical protein
MSTPGHKLVTNMSTPGHKLVTNMSTPGPVNPQLPGKVLPDETICNEKPSFTPFAGKAEIQHGSNFENFFSPLLMLKVARV